MFKNVKNSTLLISYGRTYFVMKGSCNYKLRKFLKRNIKFDFFKKRFYSIKLFFVSFITPISLDATALILLCCSKSSINS